MPPISEPAANKYTKTDPCVKSALLVTWTFGLLRKAIGQHLRQNEEYTSPADVVEADAAIGVPRDEYEYHKRLGTIKIQKVHTLLSHGHAKHLLLVWLVVCSPIMVLHYYLFANGKFFSHRGGEDEAATVFDFVGDDARRNHLLATMGALCAMLMDVAGSKAQRHLRLLHLKLGPINDWPVRVREALQASLILGISTLWRKLIVFFESYPWALAPAFDESRTEAQRRATLEKFFAAEPCCLDMGLSRQLRKAFPADANFYLGTPLAEFLTAVFTRLVVTSTQVELLFSKYTALTDTREKRLGYPGLCAQAMNQSTTTMTNRWRTAERMGQKLVPVNGGRPVWVNKLRKKRKNGCVQPLHRFCPP